jgi:hypothetical protein
MSPARFLASATLMRLMFGATGLLRPMLLSKACGMQAEDTNEETRFLMRVFATRDLVMALRHLHAARHGDDAAMAALGDAAVTGAMDGIAIVADIVSRGQVRGAARAAALFAVSDGIGFPLAYAYFRRSSPVRAARLR